MILISHRGNLVGRNSDKENSPEYIENAIHLGYDVECDLWVHHGKWFLGHDGLQYRVNEHFLNKYSNRLWIHCKNFYALREVSSYPLHYFWHQHDKYAITSRKYIWTEDYDIIESSISILMMTEKIPLVCFDIDYLSKRFAGICSDCISFHKRGQ